MPPKRSATAAGLNDQSRSAPPPPMPSTPPGGLSTNHNTVKVRARQQMLKADPGKWQREKARERDRAAKSYAVRKLKRTDGYKNSDQTQQQALITRAEADVMAGRIRDKVDYDSVVQAQKDLLAENWDDIEDEDEELTRADDLANNEVIPVLANSKIQDQLRLKAMLFGYDLWKSHWISTYASLREKLHRLSRRGYYEINAASYKATTARHQPFVQLAPTDYFEPSEIAMWSSMQSWNRKEWVELPGPARWWNGTDDIACGFVGSKDAQICANAFLLAFVPERFKVTAAQLFFHPSTIVNSDSFSVDISSELLAVLV
ncbi:uncharacterized protein BP5553_05637 [Venustampulla echinocandica]|uniref:Uncharacterized protein n=1 Tax=Venustampulla echinocandica TaxID=2656787 RepID=A0A370T954_9HELO|nr:uncharacterized protein BP5553_10379 [Venustampulla echinocandica]XP_031867314.1 uncharacterized protein BP5553_07460 [Venustampulla echinocandica]XP_031869535.1 uncharacterized protein BP5553_06231 [Venustampulla echinocandica]XP_031870860.1 uncharacterized protein BP5553_05637 [Venustampulla echinocandica]RDL30101.1 hypothetical protein BP5553_10379 [Venustampulla echinocandica]RDL34332.1 hypothetical protein BP5553_07460 [Venustampulla echinocandica]RDL36879.1 hypothetical protein BP555